MRVKKNSGVYEEYDANKVRSGIFAAFKKVSADYDEDLARQICDKIVLYDGMTTKELRDQVEDMLMEVNKRAAKAYIKHRDDEEFIKDRVRYMDEYADSVENAATTSETDPNANVTQKNVANLDGEVYKMFNRRGNRYKMVRELRRIFPEVAEDYLVDIMNHIIYPHDEASAPSTKNYCEAVSMYPIALEGTKTMDGLNTQPPKNLNSFCGQLVNLTFSLAGQCRGAVAFGEFFNFLDRYIAMDFGQDYIDHLDDCADGDVVMNKKTVRQKIHQAYQQIVYGWNQPMGNRASQSPFTNISYYDSYYWHALFDEFYFPDGTQPKWERVSYLQKDFMNWFNTERSKTLLTFPVETMALLTDGKDAKDKEYKDFTAEMWSKGHSFFLFLSDKAEALASCCFSANQKVLWKSSTKGVQLTTLKELHDLKWEPDKKNLKIFHNGSWVSGHSIKLPNRKMYKVVTANNKEFYMTDNHINVTMCGEKETKDLTTSDYLMFNTMSLNAIPEHNEHLSYDQGFIVGMFLGDGSFGTRHDDGTIYEINFSLNEQKFYKCKDIINRANKSLGGESSVRLSKVYNNVYPTTISSKIMVAFIQQWTNWQEGTCSYNKELNLDCLLQSYEFRKGILDGWYATDGGNSNRCYTTSERLAECMETLITSLGKQSIINISDRTDTPTYIRGELVHHNYPLYCVRWYDEANHRKNKDKDSSWIKKNNSVYFRVKEIAEYEYSDDVYCIECRDESEPYFTLPSGLITHNCRLRNELDANTFSFTNGLTGVQTGSANVITLNLNRIIQNYFRGKGDGVVEPMKRDYKTEDFEIYFRNIIQRVIKYQIAFKNLLYDVESKGLLTASNAGYIKMNKLFSTIGVNGFNESAEFVGLKCSYNDDYMSYCDYITSIIVDEESKVTDPQYKMNLEFVPAESLGGKNYSWDKEDGYWVPEDRVLYNSYFYLAEDDNTSVLDKLRMHGSGFVKNLTGGVGCHINLEDHLSKGQYTKLIDFAIANGTSYFTFNVPNCECKSCGHIEKHHFDACPTCGSDDVTDWTRIIGYLRPVSAFEKKRRIEASKRVYAKTID